jgi:CRP/FNR family cyclic AMP-dependent transcriptional regulator
MTESNLFLNLFRHRERAAFAAGQTVIETGGKGDTMYVVFEGEIEIRTGDSELEVGGPGTIVGEMALIDDGPRSATVVAKTDCQMVPIDRRRFEFMVQETPFFALAVMRIMADRLRRVNTRVASASGRTASQESSLTSSGQ